MLIKHIMTLEGSTSYVPTADKFFSLGMTEEGRIIMKQQLDRDYTLLRIEFELHSGQFISTAIPAMIRVYQTDFASDAKFLLITEGPQHDWNSTSGTVDETINHFEMNLNLDITRRESTREVVIDAWAPDSWSGWTENGGIYGTRTFNTKSVVVGQHINAQPLTGTLQIFGRPLHQIPT